VQYVFLELPKYTAGAEPQTTVEKWAYFFREAEQFEVVPSTLAGEPFRDVLDVARTASFSLAEWEAYERAKMAEQDARGMLSLAKREGLAEGLRRAIQGLCRVLAIELSPERGAALEAMGIEELTRLQEQIERERRWG
jgi:hypothetical protein